MPAGEGPTSGSTTSSEFAARLAALKREGPLPMRALFGLAKEFIAMPPLEIEHLLEHPQYETRVGAVSIMDFQARLKRTPPARRRALFELYLRRHDRIDTWDMVDRAAPFVVGGYLSDKPRDPLYDLAKSAQWYERRTAIVATYYFIRQDDLHDTFAIADTLALDDHHLVQKAVGGWVREAGKRDETLLRRYLDRYAATMPSITLRYAIEHLDPAVRQHYLDLGQA
jgi:hypothetical protein